MADPLQDQQPQEPDVSQLILEARKSLDEIRVFREQAEAHLKAAETARKNADSEGLLAFNAKKACEEHATTISGIKGTVEADAKTIATNKQRSDEALAAVNTAKASIDADIKAVDSRRKEIDQSAITADQAAATTANRLKETEALRESAEKQVKVATDSAKAAGQAATDAGSACELTKKWYGEATNLGQAISTFHERESQAFTETETLLAKARKDTEELKKVLEHLAKSDEIATDHENRVEALKVELGTLINKVEGLLPGATSAGLASSFNKQRSRFTGPQKQWLSTFVVCIGLLIVLGIPTFLSAIGWIHPTDQSWNATWRSLALRLPILLPIVWLAIYAGRNYMMSLRMEEDYAYKEAISTAFEGYKREMGPIGASEGDNPTPITILCTNILRAIAERPGRIYEGRQKDITLLTEVQELAEKSAELSKKQLAKH